MYPQQKSAALKGAKEKPTKMIDLNKRRKLKNENLESMIKSSETLLEDFIELETQYIGRLKQIPKSCDIGVKKVLLNLMKDAQYSNNLPKILTPANDAILRINAYILELLSRDTEQMIAAIPVHNIYRICYANEAEDSHVIAIQSADNHENYENFDVYLTIVNTKIEAEIICQLIKKCFELLYIERTMSLLDQVIGDDTNSNCSTSISVAARRQKNATKISTLKIQNINDVKSMISMSIKAPKKPIDNSKKSIAGTETTNTSLDESAYRTIDEFIQQLKKELTKPEYETFGLALAKWQKGEDFEIFCKKAVEILGRSRFHLLEALKPFVPDKNEEWFCEYVKSFQTEQMRESEEYAVESDTSSIEEASNTDTITNFYFSQEPSQDNEEILIKRI